MASGPPEVNRAAHDAKALGNLGRAYQFVHARSVLDTDILSQTDVGAIK
jgi:hypothetical protein